jgi:hypothetical protein
MALPALPVRHGVLGGLTFLLIDGIAVSSGSPRLAAVFLPWWQPGISASVQTTRDRVARSRCVYDFYRVTN